MKHNLKKAVALCSALACIGTFASVFPKESYAATNVLLGDADGDGQVNINDAVSISQFLLGKYTVTDRQFTAMDFNQDGAVTKTDALMIQYVEAGSITPTTVNKELYDEPDQDSRGYFRHICSSSDATSKSRYSISPPEELTASSTFSYEDEVSPYILRDQENTNVVQLDLNGNVGSGFIVGSHVIATAAHNVYDRTNGNFINNIKVNIYNMNGAVNSSNLVHTSDAKELHIPLNYVYPDWDLLLGQQYSPENYDYALIYVEDDLSEYGIWNMGVLSDSFMNSSANLTTSGFAKLGGVSARYYDKGMVTSLAQWILDEANIKRELVVCSQNQFYDTMYGGVTYYESTYNDTPAKSAVGVNTGFSVNTGCSWSVRMNPNLIWFYKQNPKAGK